MKEHIVNGLSNTFIGGWYMEDTAVCQKLIDWHAANKDNEYYPYNSQGVIRLEDRSSKVVPLLEDNEMYTEYGNYISTVYDAYRTKYECATISNGEIRGEMEIHNYYPAAADSEWYYDAFQRKHSMRRLTFITFLNNIPKGGEIEFKYQNIKIKPEKGLTIFFPCDWTHVRRVLPLIFDPEIPSETIDKYLITGWVEST